MRILAVDDDPIILDLLSVALSTFGYEDVFTAPGGHEALTILQQDAQGFDSLLYDIQMPLMDGIALVTHTRAMQRYSDTPILMLTAMSDKSYIDRAFQAGATDYITKPFEPTELQARLNVARMLSEAQSRLSSSATAAQDMQGLVSDNQSLVGARTIQLEEPLPIKDVEGVIPLTAFRNYVQQLGRGAIFGSSIMAFKVDNIERISAAMSDYDYTCLVTDIAEAISIALHVFPQSLLTHAGNGVFLCSTDRPKSWQLESLPLRICQTLADIEPCYGDGRSIMLNVNTGKPVISRAKTDELVAKAISHAIENASIRPLAINGGKDSGTHYFSFG